MNPNNVKVSVIIPTYNRANSIHQSIQSVLNQTYKNIELIIVDDGSTDSTMNTLEKYGKQLKAVYQKNQGPSYSRNYGVSLSSGEFIAFLDSDDTWEPTKIENQVQLLDLCGRFVPCCICNAVMRNSKGKTTTLFKLTNINPRSPSGILLNPTEILATRFILFNQTAIVRRKSFEAIGGFNENLNILEDYDIALRLSSEGPWAYIDRLLVKKNESDHSLGKKGRDNRLGELITVISILDKFISDQKMNSNLNKILGVELRRLKNLQTIASLSHSHEKISLILGKLMGIKNIILKILGQKTLPDLISIHDWKSKHYQ
jgi:glycosyltransferase involved in cell wall biosynthesis